MRREGGERTFHILCFHSHMIMHGKYNLWICGRIPFLIRIFIVSYICNQTMKNKVMKGNKNQLSQVIQFI